MGTDFYQHFGIFTSETRNNWKLTSHVDTWHLSFKLTVDKQMSQMTRWYVSNFMRIQMSNMKKLICNLKLNWCNMQHYYI